MVNEKNNIKGSEVAYLSIFGPLRDKIGSHLVVVIPKEGLSLNAFTEIIKRDYGCDIKEYINKPQTIFLLNGRRLQTNDLFSAYICRGDQLLLTVAISGG